jgi:hypothetical protein
VRYGGRIAALSALLAGIFALAIAGAAQARAPVGDDLGTANGTNYRALESGSIPAGDAGTPYLYCADEKRTVGVGARSLFSPVHLVQLVTGPRLGEATLVNDGGAEKHFTVYLICRDTNTTERYEKADRGPKQGESLTLKANCGRRQHVLSGGFKQYRPDDPPFLNTHLAASVPFDDGDANEAPDDGWRVKIFNPAGSRTPEPTATAICAKGAKPKYRSDRDQIPAGQSSPALEIPCPDGTTVVGGGIGMGGGAFITSTFPADTGDEDEIPQNAWTGVMHTDSGGRTLTAHAVCLP